MRIFQQEGRLGEFFNKKVISPDWRWLFEWFMIYASHLFDIILSFQQYYNDIILMLSHNTVINKL